MDPGRRLVIPLLALIAMNPVAVRPVSGTAAQPAAAAPIDPARSHVGFTVTKLGYSDVEGMFRDFEVNIHYDARRPELSSVRWKVRVASVKTDAANRDSSLLAAEYFDAARYPELRF